MFVEHEAPQLQVKGDPLALSSHSFYNLTHARAAHKTPLSAVPARFLVKKRGGRTSQRAGRAYEKRVFQYLEQLLFGHSTYSVELAPWLSYELKRQRGIVQPDAVLLRNGIAIAIIEIKLRHTVNAYYQMKLQYEPLVRIVWPAAPQLRLIEITQSFDAGEAWPVDFNFGHSTKLLFNGDTKPLVLQLSTADLNRGLA